MDIQFKKIKESAILPSYQTDHSAGMDLHACIGQPVTIKPLGRQLIPCGFAMALPKGYEAQIRARSGLALKHGLAVANGIGTIDADYRGEVGVILINLGSDDFIVQPGDRIAQLVIAKYERAVFEVVTDLGDSGRGQGGFGSTGV